eukprot:1155278-Prymnesium_polylepis.1
MAPYPYGLMPPDCPMAPAGPMTRDCLMTPDGLMAPGDDRPPRRRPPSSEAERRADSSPCKKPAM